MDDLSARLLEDEAMDDETLNGFVDRLFDFEKNNVVVNEAPTFIGTPSNRDKNVSLSRKHAIGASVGPVGDGISTRGKKGVIVSDNQTQLSPLHLFPQHDISPQDLSQHSCSPNLRTRTAPPEHGAGSLLPQHFHVSADFCISNPTGYIPDIVDARQSSSSVAPHTNSVNRILNADHRNQFDFANYGAEHGLSSNLATQQRSMFGEESQYASNLNLPASIYTRNTIETNDYDAALESRQARARRAYILRSRRPVSIMRGRRNTPVPILPRIANAEAIAVARATVSVDELKRIKSRKASQDYRRRQRERKVAIKRELALYEYEHRQFDGQLFSNIDKIGEEARSAGVNISETRQ